MKIQQLLIAVTLPLLLILSGCEATNPTVAATAEPVVTPASTPAPAAVTPKIEAVAAVQPEHCKHHQMEASKHDCVKHCAKHKGKKGKACIKHCEKKAAAEHDCVEHCEHHKGAAAHQ
jgi:hypothetical protein